MRVYFVRGACWAGSLLLAASLVACIDRGDDGSGGDGNGNGVPEGPLGRDGGDGDGDVAPGSPLDIPEITQAQGQPVERIRSVLEADLAEQCGGELCVEVRVEPGDNDTLTLCQFDTTEPPPGEQVERDGTVVLVTGISPCETTSPSEPPPPSQDPPPTGAP
jgi:hypothetical protein